MVVVVRRWWWLFNGAGVIFSHVLLMERHAVFASVFGIVCSGFSTIWCWICLSARYKLCCGNVTFLHNTRLAGGKLALYTVAWSTVMASSIKPTSANAKWHSYVQVTNSGCAAGGEQSEPASQSAQSIPDGAGEERWPRRHAQEDSATSQVTQ